MTPEDPIEGAGSGVYRFVPPLPDECARAAAAAGLQLLRVDTRNARDKPAFLRAAATGLRLPDHFGHNWDAFYDCLTDLKVESAAGWLVVFEDLSGFARGEPDEFAVAVDAMRDAAEFHAGGRKRLVVLVGLDRPLLAPELVPLSCR